MADFLLQIQAVTTGWVSLALTFRGNAVGADVIVGWVSNGVATLIVSDLKFCFNKPFE